MLPRNSNRPRHHLSKSRYVAGLQCPLRLWLKAHNRQEATEPDAAAKARFAAGHEVGELATQRHPDGVLVDERWPKQALAATAPLVADPSVPAIFEAAIEFEGVLVRVDVLERLDGGRWRIIEVKSSTKPKDVHLDDLALQTWVLRSAGFEVAEACLVVLNRGYVYRGGEHDLEALFTQHELTAEVERLVSAVGPKVRAFQAMLSGEAPAVAPSSHCTKPYPCEFSAFCNRDAEEVEHSIEDLPRLSASKRDALVQLGVRTIPEVPSSFRLTPTQERVRRCVANDEEYIAPALTKALESATFPLLHFDVETVAYAIPRHVGTRPYDPIPFQWSVHEERADGSVVHHEFLADRHDDPRLAFATTLATALGDAGTIVVYSSYEKRILSALAHAQPEHAPAFESAIDRMLDLLAVLRESYYHPDFYGSYSLKSVLPALVPELGYDDLEIADGGTASAEFLRMLGLRGADRDQLRNDLLAYCRRDTEALLELFARLQMRASNAAA